ncbi:putative hydrolase-oxidase [Salmonella enterica subsp. arizonae]|nr:putative hydrolase-oxidase [Salmonella enterica subsp. arizonae]
MKNTELEQLINDKLNSAAISDYAPNGLQVEGKETVQKIVTGVTASQALLDEAVRLQADAVIVHHGYFWKGESPVIRGMKRCRLKTLLANDINLYGWHLPLDAHPELGNNAQLATLLGITVKGEIEPLVPWGELSMPVPGWNWPHGLKRVWGVNRYGAAIPDRRMSSVSPGVPAADKVLLIAPPASALTLLLPARCLNRLFILRASRGCIFMPPGTMPLNVAVFAP